MESFEYGNPASVPEALAMLGARWGEADVLAGGTDLIGLMKDRLHTPRRVVNIKSVREMEGIRKTAAGLRIGALVTMDELAKNAVVKAEYTALADRHAAAILDTIYSEGFGALSPDELVTETVVVPLPGSTSRSRSVTMIVTLWPGFTVAGTVRMPS